MVIIPLNVIHFIALDTNAQPEEVGFFSKKNIQNIRGISTPKRSKNAYTFP